MIHALVQMWCSIHPQILTYAHLFLENFIQWVKYAYSLSERGKMHTHYRCIHSFIFYCIQAWLPDWFKESPWTPDWGQLLAISVLVLGWGSMYWSNPYEKEIHETDKMIHNMVAHLLFFSCHTHISSTVPILQHITVDGMWAFVCLANST